MTGLGIAPDAPTTTTLMWHYMLQFTLMTTGVIVLLYVVFWWLRRNPGTLQAIQGWVQNRFGNPNAKPQSVNTAGPQPYSSNLHTELRHDQLGMDALTGELSVESSQVLDAHTTLYVVHCGQERFLVASGPPGARRLATLSNSEQAATEQGNTAPRTPKSSLFQNTLQEASAHQPPMEPRQMQQRTTEPASTRFNNQANSNRQPENVKPTSPISNHMASNVHPSLMHWFEKDAPPVTAYNPA